MQDKLLVAIYFFPQFDHRIVSDGKDLKDQLQPLNNPSSKEN